MKFGLLAEIRRGRGLRGVHEPKLLSGIFLLFKNDLIIMILFRTDVYEFIVLL